MEAVVGLFLPLVVDFINVRVQNSNLRFIVSVVVCGLVGFLLNFDKVSWQDWAGSTAIIFLAAQTTYKLYWEKSQARAKVQSAIK